MRVIDDGMSTRLYHRLCDSRGLCYDVSAGYDGYEDDGVVDVAAGVQHKRVALVTREILAMFEELAVDGPTAGGAREGAPPRDVGRPRHGRLGRRGGGVLRERDSLRAPVDARSSTSRSSSASAPPRCARRLAPSPVPSDSDVVAVGLLDDGEDERLAKVVEGWTGPG